MTIELSIDSTYNEIETDNMIQVTMATPTMDGHEVHATREYEQGEFEFTDGEPVVDDVMIMQARHGTSRILVIDNEYGSVSDTAVPGLVGTFAKDTLDQVMDTPFGKLSWNEKMEYHNADNRGAWVEENL